MKFSSTKIIANSIAALQKVVGSKSFRFLLLLLLTTSNTGCWLWNRSPPTVFGPPAPQVLPAIPTLQQVTTAVNNNTAKVHTFISNNASISLPGMLAVPTLSGKLAMSQPSRFRLQAGTGLLGKELDLGTNDLEYWMWIRHANPPAVYVGRHQYYDQSMAKQIMPINPKWLSAAFGLVTFDPSAQYEGPTPRPDGKLEIKSTRQTPAGPMVRVYVLDAARAWVLEQHVYDAQGTLIASAIAKSYRYYPAEQVSLPQEVELNLPSAQMRLVIDVGTAVLNQPIDAASPLWTVPQVSNTPLVSLDRPAIQPAVNNGVPVQPQNGFGTPTPNTGAMNGASWNAQPQSNQFQPNQQPTIRTVPPPLVPARTALTTPVSATPGYTHQPYPNQPTGVSPNFSGANSNTAAPNAGWHGQ